MKDKFLANLSLFLSLEVNGSLSDDCSDIVDCQGLSIK